MKVLVIGATGEVGTEVVKDSKAYHAWIITPTPKGCHLWTEETMQGPHWIALEKKAPDSFWRTHEKLLADLAKVATERSSSRSGETAVR